MEKESDFLKKQAAEEKSENWESQQEMPGEPMQKWQLFEKRVNITPDGKQKLVGFYDPERNYYSLEEGEELVHIKSADNRNRDSFIRKDGKLIPFEEWKEKK